MENTSSGDYLIGLYRSDGNGPESERVLVEERRADFQTGDLTEPLPVKAGDFVMVAYPINAAAVVFRISLPSVVTSVKKWGEASAMSALLR